MFVPGKHLHSGLMFGGKAWSLHKSGAPERCFIRVGSWAHLQTLDSSLFGPYISYKEKKFYSIGPWIQNFYVLGVGQHVGVVVLDAGDSVHKLKKKATQP